MSRLGQPTLRVEPQEEPAHSKMAEALRASFVGSEDTTPYLIIYHRLEGHTTGRVGCIRAEKSAATAEVLACPRFAENVDSGHCIAFFKI